MRAAIYARYSSENQRPESITDQVSSCRKLAAEKGYEIGESFVYADEATSGARKDRAGLSALMQAAEQGIFDVVLVDDLSRLARDNYLMLSILAELRFTGVRVVSVADGLDSDDDEATLGIQIRGIFNELQLRDLKKKTLRGQIGQKERGFFVGERTFGFKSVPVGEMRMDKKGRPRPDGYTMTIEPQEAATIVRIFQEFADGNALTRIVKRFNEEGVKGQFRSAQKWSPSTLTRVLRNEKYIGRWVWNRTETRRDPRSGRRRKFPKPESEWIVREDDSLRIVPQSLWDRVRKRLEETAHVWPTGRGKRGFQAQQAGRVACYPQYLLSGSMVCGKCGSTMAQVSGKARGYYGCLGASKRACSNRLLVRRTLAERVILNALQEQLGCAQNIKYVLGRVSEEVAALCSNLPETIRIKRADLAAEERKIVNFIEFIAEGRGSRAVSEALRTAEQRADSLRADLVPLEASRDAIFDLGGHPKPASRGHLKTGQSE